MPRVLLATRNQGKLREIQEICAAVGSPASSEVHWVTLDDFPAVGEAPEEGGTFAENARQKALFYAAATSLFTLADDSGLVVDALGGDPGVHSARYAGEPKSDAANNRKLLEALANVPDEQRTARFVCAAVFARPGQVLAEAHGRVEGRILKQPRGAGGFGYDPLFHIPAVGKTAAELSPAEKHAISHRGQALRTLLPRVLQYFAH